MNVIHRCFCNSLNTDGEWFIKNNTFELLDENVLFLINYEIEVCLTILKTYNWCFYLIMLGLRGTKIGAIFGDYMLLNYVNKCIRVGMEYFVHVILNNRLKF